MAVVAWPPPTPPNTRANGDPQLNNHPGDHNKIADALDTIIGKMGRLVGYAQPIAPANIGAAYADIAGTSMSIAVVANRRYLLSALVNVLMNTAGGIVNLALSVDGTQVASCGINVTVNTYALLPLTWVHVPSTSKTSTFVVQARAPAGGLLSFNAGAPFQVVDYGTP